MEKEVAMGTVIQYEQRRNGDRTPPWDRFDRADLFAPYRDLHAQGVSQRHAAQVLEVPRTTLQAWQAYQERLDACPVVAAFFHSPPGLAFLHRLVLGIHLVCTEVGACGIRLVCLLLKLTGLDRFVGASYGTQQQVNRQVEEAIVAYRREESVRLAQGMPAKDITLTKDETFTGGLCLVGMDPVSNDIIVEQVAPARDQATWHACIEPALAGLNCRVIQSTSDEAPGLLAYVEHHLGAHHSPDLFHVQHELVKAVSGPLATKQRAAGKAATEAQKRLEQVQGQLQSAGGEPQKRGPGRPPKDTASLEQLEQVAEVARQEHQRLSAQREPVAQSIRAIGHAYHFVDLERGVRRNGKLIAADIQEQIATVRTVAQHEGLSQTCLERLEKAERVLPKMQATIEFVSGDVRQPVRQLDLVQTESYAMHAHLIPSFYLERVAQRRTVSGGEPLRELAERLRTPLFAPDGAFGALSPVEQNQLKDKAKTLAEVFQRSSSNVEGRHGYLALRNHQLRGLDHPRKRECLTAVHNFLLTRPDGTTAAERFFGQKPRAMFAGILESVEIPPAPLSPPRRAVG
jgi:DNA-binding XRE family transcriptional regulator